MGRGLFRADAVERVNDRLSDLLAREGVALDRVHFCPHRPPERCDCRKPGTGLLERAAREAAASPAESFVVGDKECDIEMGRRAGATTLLVRTGWGAGTEGAAAVRADHVVDDLLAAARIVLARARAGSGREG